MGRSLQVPCGIRPHKARAEYYVDRGRNPELRSICYELRDEPEVVSLGGERHYLRSKQNFVHARFLK